MPKASSIAQAKADKRAGKAPSTQAGHFVRDEIEAVRHGKHGVRSAKQAIAIGLSEARRAGVDLPPKAGSKSATAKSAAKPTAKSAGERRQGGLVPKARPSVAVPLSRRSSERARPGPRIRHCQPKPSARPASVLRQIAPRPQRRLPRPRVRRAGPKRPTRQRARAQRKSGQTRSPVRQVFRVRRGGRVRRMRVGEFVEIMVKPTRLRRRNATR